MPGKPYRFLISESKMGNTKKEPNNPLGLLSFKLALVSEGVRSTEGEVIHPGWKFTHWITTATSEKRTTKDIAKDLAKLLLAVGLEKTSGKQLMENPAMLNDRTVDLLTKVKKASDDFPESNAVARWIIPVTAKT